MATANTHGALTAFAGVNALDTVRRAAPWPLATRNQLSSREEQALKSSGAQPTADEVIQLMSSKLLPSHARDLECVIQLEFMDEHSFGFYLMTSEGNFEVGRGQHAHPTFG